MTTYRYNDKGYLQEVETPLGLKTLYAYDGAGRLIAETDPQGGITTYTYDVMDRVTAIKNSMNKTKTTEYDFMGHKSKESDFMGNYTQYEYDLNGNMIKKVDALSNEYLFVYDSADRLSTSSDPLGHTVSYEYDSMGRVSKTTDARGNDTTYEYDAMGNLKKQYDAYGNRLFTKKYDTKNNLIEVVDGLNRKTITTYTVFDKPSKVTDPLARVTEFKYDKVGRLIKAINAQNKEATQSYNDLGQISAFTDPNSNETSFTYSDDGHMLSTATASGSVMTNTYKDGLLDRVTNGRGDTTTLKYDALGRVIEAQNTDGVIPYTYDDNSNLLTITENGKTITRVYDRLNRVINHTDIYNETIGYEYDAIGNLMKLIYPDGKEVGYSYDENSNLIEVKEGSLKTSYEYDKNSRLVKMTRPNGTVLDRIYDEVGQLTSQTDKTSSGIIIVSVSFGYDKAGNIIKEDRYPTIKPVLPTAISISYKSGNLLDEANQTTATFDADDNMVAFGARTYYYDSRNRLYQNGTATYSYDSENHRVSQTINGKTTKYTINPEASLSQLLSLTEPNGTQTTYTYGLGLVAQEKNGKKLYYHYDLRGSTIALTDKSGNIVDRWSYLPFGGQISHDVGTTKTPFLYNGRDGVMTDESGLYYMRARYYDPGIRRFINRDTLLGDVGQMATLNRFGYVNGNPVSGVDPSGHIAWVPIIAVALIIIDWATDASVAYSPENKNNEKELIENSDNVTKYYDQANYVAGYVNPVKKLFREIPTHIMRQSLANTRKNTKYKQKFNTLVQQSEKKIKQEFREISVHNTVSAIEEAADYHNSQNRFNITEKPYATPIGSPKNAFILRPYMFENCD